jgi:hypothetical protein
VAAKADTPRRPRQLRWLRGAKHVPHCREAKKPFLIGHPHPTTLLSLPTHSLPGCAIHPQAATRAACLLCAVVSVQLLPTASAESRQGKTKSTHVTSPLHLVADSQGPQARAGVTPSPMDGTQSFKLLLLVLVKRHPSRPCTQPDIPDPSRSDCRLLLCCQQPGPSNMPPPGPSSDAHQQQHITVLASGPTERLTASSAMRIGPCLWPGAVCVHAAASRPPQPRS